jgi:hypothetical protein
MLQQWLQQEYNSTCNSVLWLAAFSKIVFLYYFFILNNYGNSFHCLLLFIKAIYNLNAILIIQNLWILKPGSLRLKLHSTIDAHIFSVACMK